LTNAAKYTPGAPVIVHPDEIAVSGEPRLRLTVHNTVYVNGPGHLSSAARFRVSVP